MGKLTPEDQYPLQRRGGKGVLAMQLTDKTGDLTCLRMAGENEDLMLIRDDGTVMRMPLSQVNVISRNTQGVKLMSTALNDKVASMATMDQKNE